MTQTDEQARPHGNGDHADEDTGAAPKPTRRTASGVIIRDVTQCGRGIAIIGGVAPSNEKSSD